MFSSAARVAAVTCGAAAVRAAEENIQVHGGIGATWEHPAHLYLRRALTDRLLISDEQSELEDLAAAVASPTPPAAAGRYGSELEDFRDEVRATLDAALPAGWTGLAGIPTEQATVEFLREWRHTLHAQGLLGITWPTRYGGRGLSKLHHVVLVEELARRGVPYGRQPQDSTGLKMIGNTLLAWGTEAQKQHYLPRLLSDETRFCQGFSEPQAGSDLASVRTRARLEDGEWHLDGQKVWTSGALDCTDIFVLARTDPGAAKHRGLSLLLVPLDQPGVEVRPIRHMSGADEFCEVFFTDARTAAHEVVGPVDGGWRVARSLLTLERGDEAATNPVLFRAEFDRLVELARCTGKLGDPVLRQRIARCFAGVEVMRLLGGRILADVLDGRDVSAAASVSKLYWSEYHQQLTTLALDVEGRAGLVPVGKGPARMMRTDEPGADPRSTNSWWQVLLNSRTGTIYAGTSEVQRTILAEQLLGLPREQ
jgi:alkylation response protein AidB-like acyl-CoA dehydrogenase